MAAVGFLIRDYLMGFHGSIEAGMQPTPNCGEADAFGERDSRERGAAASFNPASMRSAPMRRLVPFRGPHRSLQIRGNDTV